MYVLKYPALESKYIEANLIKIGWEVRKILYILYNPEYGRRHFEYLIRYLIF